MCDTFIFQGNGPRHLRWVGCLFHCEHQVCLGTKEKAARPTSWHLVDRRQVGSWTVNKRCNVAEHVTLVTLNTGRGSFYRPCHNFVFFSRIEDGSWAMIKYGEGSAEGYYVVKVETQLEPGNYKCWDVKPTKTVGPQNQKPLYKIHDKRYYVYRRHELVSVLRKPINVLLGTSRSRKKFVFFEDLKK